MVRQCSRNTCQRPAVATLTYVYSDSTAVLGPLATAAEPHSYDLCSEHAARLTAPRGWEVVRLQEEFTAPPPTQDDLLALADAVREAGRPRVPEHTFSEHQQAASGQPGVRHLRLVRDEQ